MGARSDDYPGKANDIEVDNASRTGHGVYLNNSLPTGKQAFYGKQDVIIF